VAHVGGDKMKKIRESDMTDKRNNIVISPGLKVRHKTSQFEYTVDSIVKDASGKIVVLLRNPDVSRFGTVDKDKKSTLPNKGPNDNVIYEADPIDDFSTSYYEPEEESDDDLIAVPADKFEKEYDF
jgi:hypothetical protein